MPEYRKVALHEIDPPALPIREAMDEEKLDQLQLSMASRGQILPIILKLRNDRYEIEDGHRRYTAALALGWTEIQARICSDDELKEDAWKLDANICREDLSDAEIALWMRELSEQKGYTEAQLCQITGRKPDWVGDRLRLFSGCPKVFDALRERKITFSVARELNKITDEKFRLMYLDMALRDGVSYVRVREWVNGWKTHHAGNPLPETKPEQPAAGEAPPPPANACCYCGGHADPWNIVHVPIHTYHLETLRRILTGAAQEQ